METNSWVEFKLGNLFKVKKAFAYNNETLPPTDSKENTINCITRSAINNGCDYKADYSPDLKVEEGNALTIGGEGIICFYQSDRFVCGTNMTVLRHEKMNKYSGLFIAAVINFYSKDRFSYGRAFNKHQVENATVKLPSSDGVEPDWKYMEDYIEKMWTNNLVDKRNNDVTIDTGKWKKFPFADVFDLGIGKGKPQIKESVQPCSCKDPNRILYVTRTDLNNGAVGFVLKDENFDVESGNAIIIGDTTATCFYQENEFITGDHIVVLRSSHLNKYTGLFISTMVKNENYRFSYGRAFKKSLIEASTILLPQTKDGGINWEYMGKVIKDIKFGNLI
ncbi:MAG: restriction endonuclease subunit S [Bacilli bacterium]|nr:restriction endonuclease subunit S [Bacilli bacterium]